jgi:hypothetical protein
MRNINRKRSVPLYVIAVLGLGLLVRLVSCGPETATPDPAGGTGSGGLVGAPDAFTITGNASVPISPGVMTPLDLNFTNRNDVALSITELSVTVRQISAPNADGAHPCTVDDFTVQQASPGLRIIVAGEATSTFSDLGLAREGWPYAGMLNRSVNQDGCKGASLTLDYTAAGTLAN